MVNQMHSNQIKMSFDGKDFKISADTLLLAMTDDDRKMLIAALCMDETFIKSVLGFVMKGESEYLDGWCWFKEGINDIRKPIHDAMPQMYRDAMAIALEQIVHAKKMQDHYQSEYIKIEQDWPYPNAGSEDGLTKHQPTKSPYPNTGHILDEDVTAFIKLIETKQATAVR